MLPLTRRFLNRVSLLSLILMMFPVELVSANPAPIAAIGVVTDNTSDGTPDTFSEGSFYVLNRAAPFQEERGIVEFDVSTLKADPWVFHAAVVGGTGGVWPLEIWGYIGDGNITLEDFNLAGATLLGTVVAGPADTWTVNVSTYINERIVAQDQYVGFVVRRSTEGAGRTFWDPTTNFNFVLFKSGFEG